MPGPPGTTGRQRMTGPQRLSGVVAVAASGFATLIALLPTWTLPAVDESDLANRVPWWDPQLVAQGNPLPAVALLAVAAGFVLVLISRMRQRPTWWPVWLFGAAIVVTVAGVFVGGAWFLVVNAVGVLFTALGMALLMVAQPKPRATRRPEPTA